MVGSFLKGECVVRIHRKFWLWVFCLFPVAANAITVSPKSMTVAAGQVATIAVSNYSDPLRAGSTNNSIATAFVSGNTVSVYAVKAGATSVVVNDPKGRAVIPITVRNAMLVRPESLVLRAGGSSTLNIVNRTGAANVTSSSPGVATVSLAGNVIRVTGYSPGTATLTVRDTLTTQVIPLVVTEANAQSGYTLLAWNDLGMHCMDSDYSVFSILPPFNNLHAQLVDNVTGRLIKDATGISMTYEAVADPAGSVNSYSINGPVKKTNFWDYVAAFFGGNPGGDIGLTGNSAPSYTPQSLTFNASKSQFEASGIPITPYDDAGRKNTYPMVKVVAKDVSGNQLAVARVVLPVSDEMNCSGCHSSNAGPAAKPKAGWINDRNPDRDYRLNILQLHDEKAASSQAFQNALNQTGYAPGLKASAQNGKPVLCAACHSSNALGTAPMAGIASLTSSMHARHAQVIDPKSGLKLDSSDNRSACYLCHPGSTTKCLRGAMGNATLPNGAMEMQCQSCHGSMSKVGATARTGWLQQPNCQACHHNGKRELSAITSTGMLKTWTDKRFATNPNTPAGGFSLFRMSSGHGGLQCEACHGATHAEYTSSHINDNLISVDTQGYMGTIGECSACHASVPFTVNAGPHGMHTVGQEWVNKHGDIAEGRQAACAYCHGANYRGTALSAVKVARTFLSEEGRSKAYIAGQKVGCYDCHNGPAGD